MRLLLPSAGPAWQGHRKRGAAPRLRLDLDFAAVGLHDLADDVQTQAQAVRALGPVYSFKALEDPPPMLSRDPGTSIADAELHDRIFCTHTNVDRFGPAILDGIRHEIGDDLCETRLIPAARHRLWSVHTDLNAAFDSERLQGVDSRPDDVPEIAIGHVQIELAGRYRRCVEQAVDERRQSLVLLRQVPNVVRDPWRRIFDLRRRHRPLQNLDLQPERGHWRTQLMRCDRQEVLADAHCLLRVRIEPRVLDGDRGAVRELLRKSEVGLAIAAVIASGNKCDGA